MKLKLIISALIVGLFFQVNAQQTGRNKCQMSEGKDFSAAKLNLTEQQKQEITELKFANKEKELELKNQISKNRLKIEKMIKLKKLDESKIKELVKENSDLKAKIADAKIDLWFRIRDKLTDEQKTEWIKHFKGLGFNKHCRMKHNGKGMRNHCEMDCQKDFHKGKQKK